MVQKLRSQAAPWPGATPEFLSSLQHAPKDLDRESLIDLVYELDRRFMQLYDKVTFERQNGLVAYDKLQQSD